MTHRAASTKRHAAALHDVLAECEAFDQRASTSAQRTASAAGADVLTRARLELELETGAINENLSRLLPTPWLWWHDTTTGELLVGCGSVVTVSAAGRYRFDHIARQCRRLTQHHSLEPLDPTPLWLCGFSFGRDAGGAEWRGWPGGLAFVPRLLLRQPQPVGLYPTRVEMTLTLRSSGSGPDQLEVFARGVAERIRRTLQQCNQTSLESSDTPSDRIHRADPEHHTRQRADWHRGFGAAMRHLSACALRKVVLARTAEISFAADQPLDLARTLEQLAARQPNCTVFGLRLNPTGSTFFGATPELLLSCRGRIARTTALAGTAPADAIPGDGDEPDGETTLLAAEKEREEHQLVIESIARALGKARLTYNRVPQIRRLERVVHLETPIRWTMPVDCSPLAIVGQLHPTAAVGGMPDAAARAWIAQNEQIQRGWYAAPIGWFAANGDAEFRVALRSALAASTPGHERVIAYAGAGLTASSREQLEWDETELKLSAVVGALATRCRQSDQATQSPREITASPCSAPSQPRSSR